MFFFIPSQNSKQYNCIRNQFKETSSDFGLPLLEELAVISTYRGLMIKHKGCVLKLFDVNKL